MKKLLAALTLALLCSVALVVSAANATGSNYDFVNGSSIDVGFFGGDESQKLHVNAKSAADGSQAQGMIFVQSKGTPEGFDIDLNADVTCLNVVGNSATIGSEVTRSNHPDFPVGTGLILIVTDNGEPGDEDAWTGFPLDTPPEVCPPPIPLTNSESKGNFVVHDATLNG